MFGGILYLTAASAASVAPGADDQADDFRQFCIATRSASEAERATLKQCRELAELLRAVELDAIAKENAADLLAMECRRLVAEAGGRTPLTKFEDALRKANQTQAATTASTTPAPSEPPPCSVDSALAGANSAEFKETARKFADATAAARKARSDFDAASSQLAAWHAEDRHEGLFVDAKPRPAYQREDLKIASLDECRLDRPVDQTEILNHPNDCATLARLSSDPETRWAGGPRVSQPSRPKILPSLTTSASGSNAALTLKGQFKRYVGAFDTPDDKDRRRPSTLSYSLGIEGKATDGIAGIVGVRPEDDEDKDAGFFDLDRLSSSVAVKGSIGVNFYPWESRADFEKRRIALLKEMTELCEKSLKEKKTKVDTDCRDGTLLTWLYEREGKAYARLDRIEAYEKLIWSSSATYPQLGFGLTGTAGLRSQRYNDFSDAAGKFDPSLVDLEAFFSEAGSARKGRIDDKLIHTFGTYAYRHWDFSEHRFLDGITTRFDAQVKYDIQDLKDKAVAICRQDTSKLGGNGVYLDSQRCKSTIPFLPEFQRTAIFTGAMRIGTLGGAYLPPMGFVPSIAYENGPDVKGVWRVELPAYFTLSDNKLTGGIGIAHEIDRNRKDNQAATSIFLTIGKEFTLDGSK